MGPIRSIVARYRLCGSGPWSTRGERGRSLAGLSDESVAGEVSDRVGEAAVHAVGRQVEQGRERRRDLRPRQFTIAGADEAGVGRVGLDGTTECAALSEQHMLGVLRT